MANHHGCINGTLQGTDNYSTPVPVIGLYIAASSALCALLMLYDIVSYGFLKTQRWLPCKWFKLNSVTLSLIGVVVKLTVDLTTSMPSSLDQLSKLAGTTSLCIYMCYIYPSISDMKDSTNMLALSILVVTVFINMCIQLSTGVIALFFPEHIVMMCIMLVLITILWRIVFLSKNDNKRSVATSKSDFMAGKREASSTEVKPNSFLKRLEDCYLDSYNVNPQLKACRRTECAAVGELSLISLAIFVEAAIRSIVLKREILCKGQSSDYQWSMGMIVVTQSVFIIIGSLASCFRKWTMLFHMDLATGSIIEEPYLHNPIWKGKFSLVLIVEFVYIMALSLHFLLVYWSVTLCLWVLLSMRKAFSKEELLNSREDFKSFPDFIDGFVHSNDNWLKLKSVSSMERLNEGSNRKSNGLCGVLSNIGSFDMLKSRECFQEIQCPSARLHPLVVLVRLAEVAIPASLCQERIVKTFKEAFETLYFIEKHIHNTTLEDIKQTEIAKALWKAGEFGCLLPVNSVYSNQCPPVDRAFHVMDSIYERMRRNQYRDDSVVENVILIRVFLKRRSYSSVEELGNFMQDLFAYLLNIMLAQLPDAIFKAVSLSPDDEFEEQVRLSLKHFSMLQSWNGIHNWELPQGIKNCTGLLYLSVEDEGKELGNSGIHSLEEQHVAMAEDEGTAEIQII